MRVTQYSKYEYKLSSDFFFNHFRAQFIATFFLCSCLVHPLLSWLCPLPLHTQWGVSVWIVVVVTRRGQTYCV